MGVYFLPRNIRNHQRVVSCLTSLRRHFLCFVCDYLKWIIETNGHADVTPCYHILIIAIYYKHERGKKAYDCNL